MVWVSILLGLIEAIPEIVQLIQDIVALLHGHPFQALHEHAFLGILRAWHDSKDATKVIGDLHSLHAKLAA